MFQADIAALEERLHEEEQRAANKVRIIRTVENLRIGQRKPEETQAWALSAKSDKVLLVPGYGSLEVRERNGYCGLQGNSCRSFPLTIALAKARKSQIGLTLSCVWLRK